MEVVCQNLSYSYSPSSKNKKYALSDVTLTIKEGDFFGVIGHTGSGKSTFIQHLNGLIPVQNGKLTVGEYDLTDKSRSGKAKLKELRRKVGMVFQYPEYQLFAETVFEDVAFGVRNFYKQASAEFIAQKVKSAMQLVGLDFDELKDKSPFSISGGQKRRVALAGVIAVEPEILVLDEPCAGLDPQGKTSLWQLLHKLHGTFCKTVIVVSHDMNDVAEQCDKAVVFSDGKAVACGSPRELFSGLEDLEKLGLESPVTGYLTEKLKPSVTLDTDFTIDDFCDKLVEKLKEKS
ncbi:MAG: energy-coupling factor transporter ATPase [Clostridia bacterium]|nr:energy-coupling factor transporter ATPase [Clostridia bacterium]